MFHDFEMMNTGMEYLTRPPKHDYKCKICGLHKVLSKNQVANNDLICPEEEILGNKSDPSLGITIHWIDGNKNAFLQERDMFISINRILEVFGTLKINNLGLKMNQGRVLMTIDKGETWKEI